MSTNVMTEIKTVEYFVISKYCLTSFCKMHCSYSKAWNSLARQWIHSYKRIYHQGWQNHFILLGIYIINIILLVDTINRCYRLMDTTRTYHHHQLITQQPYHLHKALQVSSHFLHYNRPCWKNLAEHHQCHLTWLYPRLSRRARYICYTQDHYQCRCW